jgi:hypothetical protein
MMDVQFTGRKFSFLRVCGEFHPVRKQLALGEGFSALKFSPKRGEVFKMKFTLKNI